MTIRSRFALVLALPLAVVGLAAVRPSTAGAATTVVVEGQSIQAAIDAASPGDTIWVAAGTYSEAIDFKGKDVAVRGHLGADIDAGPAGITNQPLVKFSGGETRAAVLAGFSIRGASGFKGSGISITNASPTISGNFISDNQGCTGSGIYSSFGSPRIVGNSIIDNTSAGAGSGCRGGGIRIGGASSAEIVGNHIERNFADSAGGGIDLFASGTPFVARNVIADNEARSGTQISSANAQSGRFEQNLVLDRSTGGGPVVDLGIPSSGTTMSWVNNTIGVNGDRLAVDIDGWTAGARFRNNVVVGGFLCGDAYPHGTPSFAGNILHGAFTGACESPIGTAYNWSWNPLLDFDWGVLGSGSPALDTGLPVQLAGTTDVFGGPRYTDANGDGDARIDRGAVEATTPPSPGAPRSVSARFADNDTIRIWWDETDGNPPAIWQVVVLEAVVERNVRSSEPRWLSVPARGNDQVTVRVRGLLGGRYGPWTTVVLDETCHPTWGCTGTP